ncbi:MAG: mandelate racemase/muconate lactonizing enzyme family protein [Sulfolobales archaeon]
MDRIRDLEIYILGGRDSPDQWASASLIIRVLSDDGEIGYGEAIPTRRVNQVVKAFEEIKELVKGREVYALPKLYWEWYKHEYYLPFSIESVSAYSAFDIAIYDLLGRRHGMPIYMLLGGLARDKIKVYANAWYRDCVSPECFAEKAKKAVAMGFKALKFDPFGPYFDIIDRKGLDEAVERVRAVREAVGRYVDLLIEFHGRFNVSSAISAIRELEQFDPLFYEEPIHPEKNLEGLRRIRMVTSRRIALGERILFPEDAARLLRDGLVDVLQPDITNCLGFTGITRIRALAEVYSAELAPHNAFGPIQHAATIQFDANTNNLLIQESFYEFWPEWKRKLIKDPFKIESGYHLVPRKPGLGVDVDDSILNEMRIHEVRAPYSEEPVWVVKNTWRSYIE